MYANLPHNSRTVFVNANNLTHSPRHVCGNPVCATRTDGAEQLAASFKVCGRCRCEWYCSPACQRIRWPEHKAECKPLDSRDNPINVKKEAERVAALIASDALSKPDFVYHPTLYSLAELKYPYHESTRRDIRKLPDDTLEHVYSFLSVADFLSLSNICGVHRVPDELYRVRLFARFPEFFNSVNSVDSYINPYAAYDEQRWHKERCEEAGRLIKWCDQQSNERKIEAAQIAHEKELETAKRITSNSTAAAAPPTATATAKSGTGTDTKSKPTASATAAATSPQQNIWRNCFREWWCGRLSMRCQVFNRELSSSLDSEYFMSCFNAYASYLKPARTKPNTAAATAASAAAPKVGMWFEWSLHDSSKYSTRWSLDEFLVVYLPDHRGKISERVKRERIRANFALHHPYHVYVDPTLPSNHVFKVGDGVEIQWRQKREHPFGWWFGLYAGIDPKTKKLRITFDQYYDISPWRIVTPVLGTTVPTPGLVGELGGLRLVTDTERERWQKFMPKYKLV